MVNRPRARGTLAETAVVDYLKVHGWPYAERRTLSGSQDRGDVSGCIGLAIEVKYANAGMKLGPWLLETGVERLNAGADHGILVVKPLGLGTRSVGSWYAVMIGQDFSLLVAKSITMYMEGTSLDYGTFVVHAPVTSYTAATLRWSLNAGVKSPTLAPNEVLALTLRPPGTKDKPEAWYRVMTLDHMTRLLHAAGYGDWTHDRTDAPAV